jgi:hypothetical protein
MIRKGIVSSIDEGKARVFFPDINTVSPKLHYSADLSVNDMVLVAFIDQFMTEGAIIYNLSSDSGGGTSNETYVHNQLTPSGAWTIAHNLNKYPSVQVVDSAGTAVFGDVQYINSNSIVIQFSTMFAGKAYLN